ncbi:MAG: amidohydrolase [bacterium]
MTKPLLLYNAHFYDFYKPRRKIQALLIRNGVIEKTYKKKPQLTEAIKKYDLKGNHVIPGFIDSHTHLISRGIELQRIDLEKCKSLSDCLEKLRAGLTTARKIIFASNWDESNWHSFKKEDLDRHTLDKISRKIPVIMRRICGHFAVINTCGLHSIPRGWHIVDWEKGHLYEDAALYLNDIFQPDRTMLKRAIKLGTAEALSKGITTVHEITNPGRFRLLQDINKKNGLKLRFSIYILLKSFREIFNAGFASGLGDDFLKFSGVKIFLDGSIGAKTAALTTPYSGGRTSGKMLMARKKLEEIVSAAEKNNIQLMIHSIGDQTTAMALKAIEKALKPSGSEKTRNLLRHRLEHLEVLSTSLIRKIAKLRLVCSMQPNFACKWQNPGSLYERYLGDRYKTMNCFKNVLKAGIRLAFGSDCMPLGPLYGLQGATCHPFACGRLKPIDAFRCYTAEGAFATFDEKQKGKIDDSFLADLVVLDKDPLAEKDTSRIKILMTMVNGEFLYKR